MPFAAVASSILLAAATAWGLPAADERAQPAGTKLGTRDGRKVEPLEGLSDPPALPRVSSRAGAVSLPHRERRAGVRLGLESLDSRHYLLLAPELDLPLSERVAAGFALPLRLEYLRSGEGLGLHRLRSEDSDGLDDLGRFVTWFRWAGDDFTVEASRFDATTVGRGALVRRYQPNIVRDSAALSLGGEARPGDATKVELFLDQLFAPELAAARLEVAPARSSFTRWLRTLELGVTYATDLDAPLALERFPSGVPHTSPSGEFEVTSSHQIWAAGVDAGAVLLDAGNWALEPWLDASFLGDAGNGQTLGLRFWLRPDGPSATTFGSLSIELRNSSAGYVHGYFDTFYRLSRIQLIRPAKTYLSEPKYTAVSAGEGGMGAAVEGAYGFGNLVRLAAGFEIGPGEGARSAFVHGEARLFPWLELQGAIYRLGLSSGERVLQLGGTENTVATALVRVKPLAFLWLHAGSLRLFELDRSIGAYRTVAASSIELELGWEL